MIGQETWSPPWAEESDAEKPVFTWRHGSVAERNMLEAEAAGRYRAAEVAAWAVHEAFASGITHLLGADDADGAHLITLSQSAMVGEELTGADAELFDRAQATLMQHWPSYSALIEQRARRDAIMPTLAFARFVTGWEGVTDRGGQPVLFKRGLDGGVADSALQGVEPWILLVLGLNIFNSLYARGLEKNSGPRSKSGSARKISATARRSPGAGKSGRTSGKKTPV